MSCADPLERIRDDGPDPTVAYVVHEEARDAALALPTELLLAGPIAAEPDLDVPGRVDVAFLDELVHRRPVGEGDAEDLGGRVGVSVEVDETDRAAALRHCADVGLGDRVIAAEDEREYPRLHHLRDRGLDRLMGAGRVRGQDRRIAEINHLERFQSIDSDLEVRPRRAAGRPDRAGAVTRPRPVGHEIIRRRADDRHVRAGQLSGILGIWLTAVGEEARVVRLLAVWRPASERVDHRPILPRHGNVAAWLASTIFRACR